jgi:hypothetical protein
MHAHRPVATHMQRPRKLHTVSSERPASGRPKRAVSVRLLANRWGPCRWHGASCLEGACVVGGGLTQCCARTAFPPALASRQRRAATAAQRVNDGVRLRSLPSEASRAVMQKPVVHKRNTNLDPKANTVGFARSKRPGFSFRRPFDTWGRCHFRRPPIRLSVRQDVQRLLPAAATLALRQPRCAQRPRPAARRALPRPE